MGYVHTSTQLEQKKKKKNPLTGFEPALLTRTAICDAWMAARRMRPLVCLMYSFPTASERSNV